MTIHANAQELKHCKQDSLTVVNISEAGVRRHLPAVGASSSSINDDLPLSILPWSSGALLGLVGALASAKPHAYVCSVPLGCYRARSNVMLSLLSSHRRCELEREIERTS